MKQNCVKNLVKAFWNDSVISQLIPNTLFVSIPFPLMVYGTPCIGQYVYKLTGEPGKSKQLSAPIFQVIRCVNNGRILAVNCAPFFVPQVNPLNTSAGVYPGPSLQGKCREDCDEIYEKYYGLCDTILTQMETASFEKCAAFNEWKTFFQIVAEDGFLPYFQTFFQMNACFGVPVESPNIQENSETVPEKQDSTFQPEVERTVHLPRYFRIFNEIASESQCQEILNCAKELQEKTDRQDFKVAVIGEFSRGKSHFLNQLLNTNMLPEGTIPTTGVLTQIGHAASASLVHILPNKQAHTEPLTQESCAKYTIGDDGKSPEGVLKLQFPISWLQGKKIFFYDTPGVGDLTDGRHVLATKTIHNCDAAILVISANLPCSLSEMEFLRENIILKGVPNVAIVITHLDQLRPKEVAGMVQFIEQKVHAVLPSAQLWTLNSVPNECSSRLDALGEVAVQEKIVQWSLTSELVNLRDRQTAFGILELLGTLKESLKNRLENAQKSDDEKRNQYTKILQMIQSQSLLWEQLQIDTNAQRLRLLDWSVDELKQYRVRLEDDLKISLQKTVNPHKWIHEDMPYQIRRALEGLSTRIELGVQKQLGAFRASLEQKIQQMYSASLEKSVEIYSLDNMPEMQTKCDVIDLSRTRMFQRIASGVGASLAMLLLTPPFGALIGVAGALLSEKNLSEKTEAQRKAIIPNLGIEIGKLFVEWEKAIDTFITGQFNALVEEIQTQSSIWLKAQQESAEKGLQKQLQESMILELQSIYQKTEKLICEIHSEID